MTRMGYGEVSRLRMRRAPSRTQYLVDPNQAYAQVLEEWGASAASGSLPDETLATTYVYGDDLISQTRLALAGPATTSVYRSMGWGQQGTVGLQGRCRGKPASGAWRDH